MIDIPKDTKQLVALMKRPEVGGLRFINPPPVQWKDTLSLQPGDIDKVSGRIAALVQRFPRGTLLQGTQKMLYRKAVAPQMGTVLRGYAGALRMCPEVKGDPAALLDLAQKLARYQNLQQKSGRWLNAALDLRLVLGALQWYMLGGVLKVVVARIEDPQTPREEAEKLQNKFSKLLLNKEQFMLNKDQRRQLIAQRKAALDARASDAEKRSLVADTKQALRLGRPVDRTTLERAARYNQELKQTATVAAKQARKTKR